MFVKLSLNSVIIFLIQNFICVTDWKTISIIIAPLDPPEVVVSDVTPTSIRVSWQPVKKADRYTITLSQTMEDDRLGLCLEASHTVSVSTSNLSVVIGQTDDDILRVYTTYFITVVAESDVWGSSQHSDPVIVTTKQTSNASSVTMLF